MDSWTETKMPETRKPRKLVEMSRKIQTVYEHCRRPYRPSADCRRRLAGVQILATTLQTATPELLSRTDFRADCRGSGADPKFGRRLCVPTFGHRSPDLRQPPSQVRHHHLCFSPQFQNLWLFEILSRIYDFFYLCNLQIRFLSFYQQKF